MNTPLPHRSALLSVLSLTSALAALLTGCGLGAGTAASSTLAPHTLTGRLHGGQQPIAGASLQLYAAGTTGTASAARALLPPNVTTDASGGFNITGLYTCNPGDQVYLVGSGGDAGAGPNASIALMAALGSCTALQARAATTFIDVDEVTTVASVFSLAPFMSGITNVGSDPAHSNALAAAMANTLTMVDLASGQALLTSKGNGIVPQTTINSLANSIASCINSTTASGACTRLFNAVTASGTNPTETIGATLDVALNPAANPSGVFLQASATPPFQPTLTAAPATYALSVLHPSDVLLYHNDIARTGVQSFETTLTPVNVNPTQFGKLATFTVDSFQYAQPLYVGGLGMPDGAVHNLIFAETTHATVYAFDADGASTAPLWSVNYVPSGERFAVAADYGNCVNPQEAGIVGTPVIDRAAQTMYFVTKTVDLATGTAFTHRLHAVSLIDGSEQPGSPQVIAPSFRGSGDGSVGGIIAFNGQRQNNRSALLLTSSPTGAKTVWIAYASHCDLGPYHGLLLGYSTSNLAQPAAAYNTVNGSDGGFWGSNGGAAADAQGNLYEVSGNGTFDLNTGGVDSGDSAVRLVPPAAGAGTTSMTVADSFTPSNQQMLSSRDLDFGGTEPLLFTDPASGVAPHLLVASDKAGEVYLLNADNLGGYDRGTNGVDNLNGDIQDFAAGGGMIYNFTFFNNILYTTNPLSAFTFVPGTSSSAGHFNVTPFASQSVPLTAPVVSANGTANPVVWTIDQSSALDAYTSSLTKLYDSTQAPGNRDATPAFVKFTSPVIANGKVFVSGQSTLSVYGLLP